MFRRSLAPIGRLPLAGRLPPAAGVKIPAGEVVFFTLYRDVYDSRLLQSSAAWACRRSSCLQLNSVFDVDCYHSSQAKPGNILEFDGKLVSVVSSKHTSQGRGGAFYQMELRDVRAGTKVTHR